MAALSDWRSFWDGEHSIYVNARHKDVHYRDMAEAIVSYLPSPQARVLDFGCGEATHADKVAAAAGEVLLCEAAASVRASMAARFAGNPRIRICAPEELEARPSGSLDLIVANSVVQYLSAAELERLLALWRRLLAPGGALIAADIIPPGPPKRTRRRSIRQRVAATAAGCITVLTTYSPIVRPMSWPTRTENR